MTYKEMAMQAATIRSTIEKIKGDSPIFNPENGEHFVLSYLHQADYEVHPKMISQDMNISTARVSKLLSQLEDKKMVCRRTGDQDRRQIIVEILPKGEAYYEKTQQAYYDAYEHVLKELGEADAAAYIRIQERILHIIKKQKDMEER